MKNYPVRQEYEPYHPPKGWTNPEQDKNITCMTGCEQEFSFITIGIESEEVTLGNGLAVSHVTKHTETERGMLMKG